MLQFRLQLRLQSRLQIMSVGYGQFQAWMSRLPSYFLD
jgi:hypothetical protein